MCGVGMGVGERVVFCPGFVAGLLCRRLSGEERAGYFRLIVLLLLCVCVCVCACACACVFVSSYSVVSSSWYCGLLCFFRLHRSMIIPTNLR